MDEDSVTNFTYKLVIGTHHYYGSTDQTKERRLSKHKSDSIRRKGYVKVYKFIRENGGWDKVTMEIVQVYPTHTREELYEEETKLINLDDPLCLNIIRPRRTPEERIELPKLAQRKCANAKYQKIKANPELLAAKKLKDKERLDKNKKNPEWVKRRKEIQKKADEKHRAKKAAATNAPPINTIV